MGKKNVSESDVWHMMVTPSSCRFLAQRSESFVIHSWELAVRNGEAGSEVFPGLQSAGALLHQIFEPFHCSWNETGRL
jgi:hypothetical protein